MKRVSLSIFDYNQTKLCDIYDSATHAVGQAYDVKYTEEISGYKEVSFTLPRVCNGQRNFRWNFVRNEYRLRLKVGNSVDWFMIQKPKRQHGTQSILNTVVCPHESLVLKTKNVYLVFDDENGIDTIQNLVSKALVNTGWSIGECDMLMEADETTQKVRSIKSEGKQGSYGLITEICNLFHAYPVYHADTRQVDIFALKNKRPLCE